MKYRRLVGRTMLFALVAVAALGATAVAAGDQREPGMMDEQGAQGDMMQRCKAMMARHEEMKTRVAELDAKLDELVAQMDAARGKDKVEAVARVVHTLVSEMRQTRDMMAHGKTGMMAHMMKHMQKGMMQSMMEGMSGSEEQCPMMQAMKRKETPSDEDSHAEHHD